MEAAQEALRAGKIRHIGFSSHSLDVALKMVPSCLFETVQFPFNFVCNEAADKLLPLAREHDVGFIAMKPFAGGMLKDANLVIKYLLQFDNVVPDPGIEKIKEIEEIVDIVEYGEWPPEWFFSWGYVKNMVASAKNCIQCGECEEKCPYHLPIREMIVESIEFYGRVAAEYDAQQNALQ
jgi:predicted aldo/keto reductase-like oxidoreductase